MIRLTRAALEVAGWFSLIAAYSVSVMFGAGWWVGIVVF